jgi:small subunit ribosomal protein S5
LTQSFGNQRNDESDLQEKVVQIRRVAKVVKGGRHLTFNAMVVVGDGQGSVGAGLGKGGAVPDAVRKGNTIARAAMVTVPLAGSTVPHQIVAHFGASRVVIKPARPGSGVKAGGAVRAVMEAVGVRDVVTKALGSRNPINLVKATLVGLQSMRGEPGEGDGVRKGAILPPVSPERRGPLRREGGGGFRGRDRDRDRRPGGPPRPPMSSAPRPAAPPAAVEPVAPPATPSEGASGG